MIFFPVTKKSSSRMRRFAGSRRTTRTKPFADLDGHRGVADRELRRQRGDDGGRNGSQRAPRHVVAAVLLGQGLADVVLGDRPALEQERSDTSARKALNCQRAMHVLFADGAGANENYAQSRHVWNDYRVPAVEKGHPLSGVGGKAPLIVLDC